MPQLITFIDFIAHPKAYHPALINLGSHESRSKSGTIQIFNHLKNPFNKLPCIIAGVLGIVFDILLNRFQVVFDYLGSI